MSIDAILIETYSFADEIDYILNLDITKINQLILSIINLFLTFIILISWNISHMKFHDSYDDIESFSLILRYSFFNK